MKRPIFQDGRSPDKYYRGVNCALPQNIQPPMTQSATSVIADMDPTSLLTPGRKITGISAILLPFAGNNAVDWDGFDQHVERTLKAGLIPAVNMDTGYANLIDEPTRAEVLRRTESIADGRQYVAGVFVGDDSGAAFNLDGYRQGIDQIQSHAGTPILFQSYGLIELPDEKIVEAYQTLAADCTSFLFFELGKVFAPFGRIYSLDVYEQLMTIPNAIGAKHSSLTSRFSNGNVLNCEIGCVLTSKSSPVMIWRSTW